MATHFKGPVVSDNGFSGDISGVHSGNQLMPSATVAGAGSAQTDAASVASGFTLATGANGTVGVKLPAAAAGKICIIKNADAANAILKVWPASGDAINAITADSSMSIAAKTCVMLIAYDATTWYTLPLLPS